MLHMHIAKYISMGKGIITFKIKFMNNVFKGINSIVNTFVA